MDSPFVQNKLGYIKEEDLRCQLNGLRSCISSPGDSPQANHKCRSSSLEHLNSNLESSVVNDLLYPSGSLQHPVPSMGLLLQSDRPQMECSAQVESSSGGLYAVLSSQTADSAPVQTEAVAGPIVAHFEDGGVSHCSLDKDGASHCFIEVPDGDHKVLGNPLGDMDQLGGPPDEDQSAGASFALGDEFSTPESIMRLSHKYSLEDSGQFNKMCPSDSRVDNQLGEAQDSIHADLSSDPLACCSVLEAKAIGTNPMSSHECCPVTTAQSLGVSEVAEVGSDPLSLAILMLTGGKALRHSLNALAPDHRLLGYVWLQELGGKRIAIPFDEVGLRYFHWGGPVFSSAGRLLWTKLLLLDANLLMQQSRVMKLGFFFLFSC
ncbi:hypothetical protein Nepgr_020334 [Nepenthes gracilis]|uniref:Uncharacterized protein n=1 Tax=Nepenthes gracilis TaxID=150966 RepID=A0AAD3XV53_NEPGR|nr:hypothetical protein Nepgr_020334 [Nepenthes gracilis]